MKLAIIDGDGVLWNNDARMEVAEQAAQIASEIVDQFNERFAHLTIVFDEKERKKLVEGTRWRVAFNPVLIALDQPTWRNSKHMMVLAKCRWTIILMSSNPESTRETRQAWLNQHGYTTLPLVLKDTGTDEEPHDRHTKHQHGRLHRYSASLTSRAAARPLIAYCSLTTRSRTALLSWQSSRTIKICPSLQQTRSIWQWSSSLQRTQRRTSNILSIQRDRCTQGLSWRYGATWLYGSVN